MPAGYDYTYSETSRRRFDTWVKNLSIVGIGVIAVVGSFWAIEKRRASSKAGRNKTLYELVEPGDQVKTPNSGAQLNQNGIPGEPLPGEQPGAIPDASLE